MGAMLMFYTKKQYITEGLILSVKTTDEIVPIAEITWDPSFNDACIKTFGSKLQDYIVSYDDYVNFVRIVDEAYDMIRAAYHKPIEA